MAFAHRAPQIIFLTGAPLQDELGTEQLLTGLQPAIDRFVKGQNDAVPPEPSSLNNWPNWRVLDLDTRDANTSPAQDGEQSAFMSFGSQHDQHEVNYDFLEHSLVNFARDAQDDEGNADFSFDRSTVTGESFLSNSTEQSHHSPARSRPFRIPTDISNLKDLPRADVLVAAYPQTMTLNFIVGIISVSPPRIIRMRESGRTVQLVEAIVGDETKTNVSISFWIKSPNAKINAEEERLEQQVAALRPQQVVLMTTVALRVWQDRVYGQSLSVTRERKAGTQIERLDMWAGSGEAPAKLPGLLQKKRKRVEEWIMNFAHARSQRITVENALSDKTAFKLLAEESELPPDTPA
jgi:hypothetical protein